jgi:hypothetical protein
MANVIPDETRFYYTDQTTALPGGSRPTLAREDGTKWVQDADCQLHGFADRFSEEAMAKYRMGKFVTFAQLKREYEEKWGPASGDVVGDTLT